MKSHRKMLLAGVALLASALICTAQEEKKDELVVMFVNQDGNGVADEAYKSVLKYVDDLKIKVNHQYRASGNGSDAEAFLDLLCSAYNQSIEDKSPPHLILDMTRYDVPSETTKSFTKLLGLPTVTGSFGQDGDLRQWRNLDAKRDKYLIQVTPPGDIIAEVIRAIVNAQNISNAGILFDNSIVMEHKYKSLLQNIPTRHLINELNTANCRGQMDKFKQLELFNYFIIGKLGTIKAALDAGDGLNFFDKKYAWHTISLDRDNPKTNCSDCKFLHVKPIQGNDTSARLEKLQSDYGLTVEPPIEASFYFDIMVQAITAANALKERGVYDGWQYIRCNDYTESMNIERNIDLRQQFLAMGQKETSSYAAFTNGKNGFNWQNFDTRVRQMEVKSGTVKGNPQVVANWRAGIETTLEEKRPEVLRNMSAVTVYTIVTLEN